MGTAQDNMRDAAGKGCMAKKLTEEDVREIRVKHTAGMSGYKLAAEYGVSQTTIGCVVKRKSWLHVE